MSRLTRQLLRNAKRARSPPSLSFITPVTVRSLWRLPRAPASSVSARPLGCPVRTSATARLAPAATLDAPKASRDALEAFVRTKAAAGAVRKVVTTLEECEAGGGVWGASGVRPDRGVYRAAVRALLRAKRTDLAMVVYRLRMGARESRADVGADLPLAASVIRAVLRDSKKRHHKDLDSKDVFEEVRKDCENEDGSSVEDVGRKASALIAITVAFLKDDAIANARRALTALKALSSFGAAAAVSVSEYNDMIRHFGKKRRMDGVFGVLDIMRAADVEANNETFEFLANAAVRQVEFVKGAVSMETLPDPLKAEVAFVGRSNVGKSSLVNMVCNRKALAHVSGTPGKTQQFNYFLVNGRDELAQFYLVDLPGVGYAKVPKDLQREWLAFMAQYLQYRTNLRVVFHLIDGRHGALADDEALMQQIAVTRLSGEYVVVLTKMDKMDKQRVKQSILDKTKAALERNGCPRDTPIVLSSSTSRLGRDELWRHLQRALVAVSPDPDVNS